MKKNMPHGTRMGAVYMLPVLSLGGLHPKEGQCYLYGRKWNGNIVTLCLSWIWCAPAALHHFQKAKIHLTVLRCVSKCCETSQQL